MKSRGGELEAMETMFAALADITRLRILNLMRDGEVCVCFFSEALGESQPKISRHLAYLRKSGLVETRRDGKWIHYSIESGLTEHARKILDEALKWIDGESLGATDRENLMNVCCAVDAPITIDRAPKPSFAQEPPKAPKSRAPEIETFLL